MPDQLQRPEYLQSAAHAAAAAPVAVEAAGPGHAPYRVEPDGRAVETVFAERHRANWICYGPDLTLGAGRSKVPSAHFSEYEDLLDNLAALRGVEFATMLDLYRQGDSERRPRRISLKHDVDNDIETALAMARAEAALGIRATYYILQTAPYYGRWDGAIFHRFERMADVYRRIQSLGHEIGLHQDPYSLYLRRGIDGAEATVRELAWLRGAGLDVRGAFGHSSAAVNGAESVEIFREHMDRRPEMSRPGGDSPHTLYRRQGGTARRLVLSARELGLEYLAELLLRTDVPYGHWTIVSHERCRTGHSCGQAGRVPLVTTSVRRMVERIDLDGGRSLLWQIVDVHPVTYGRRACGSRDGEAAAIEAGLARSAERGAYPAGCLIARRARGARGREVLGLSVSNEMGLLDDPLAQRDAARPAVVLLGGAALDPARIGASAGAGRRLAELVRESCGFDAEVFTCAGPGAGPRHWRRWLERVARAVPPALVVLVADDAVPQGWRRSLRARLRARGVQLVTAPLADLLAAGGRPGAGGAGHLDAADHETLAHTILARIRHRLAGPGARPLGPDQVDVIEFMHAILDTASAIPLPGLRRAVEHFRRTETILAQHAAARGHLSCVPDLARSVGLDFGCWCGFMSALMKHLGAAEVHGTDVVPEHIEAARRWTAAHGAAGLHFRVNPIDRVPCGDATFDWVIASGVYSNLNPAATMLVFRELSRVLKPGGLLLFNDGGNIRHAPTAERIAARHREWELGAGTPDDPAGDGFDGRRDIIEAVLPGIARQDASRLARETCSMWRPQIEAACRRWEATGHWPGSPFRSGDLDRCPVDPANGNAVARPNDPFAIRDELREAGFDVAFTKHPGGPRVAEDELRALFGSTPTIILIARKSTA